MNKLILIFILFAYGTASAKDVIQDLKSKNANTAQGDINTINSELLVGTSEAQAISQVSKLIQKYKNTSTEASLQFRLAELYMRRTKSTQFFEFVKQDQEAIQFLPQRVKSLSTKKFIEKAIKIYAYIEEKFPKFEQLDSVIFNKAYAKLQIDQAESAEKDLLKILKSPVLRKSKLFPDTLLAIGEINFDKRNFKNAIGYYEKIKAFKKSRVYPYGLYKLSWTEFNLKRTEKSMKTMESVIQFGHYVQRMNLDSKLDLRKEALKDMALFYHEQRKPEKSYVYFKGISKNLSPVGPLERLANIYAGLAKYKSEASVLSQLIQYEKKSIRRPFFHKKLAINLNEQEKYKTSSEQLVFFDQTCRQVLKYKSSFKDPEVKDCLSSVRVTSLSLGKAWLRIWKKSQSKDLNVAQFSEKAYRIHLREVAPNVENSISRYTFSELLFNLKKYFEASREYEKTAATIQDVEVAKSSAYSAIVSLEKATGEVWNKKTFLNLKSLISKYVQRFPNEENVLDVRFKVALIDYKKKRYDASVTEFLALGKKYSKREKGVKSQDLFLDILNLKKDFKNLQLRAQEFKKYTKDPVRVASLNKIFEESYFAETQKYVDLKNFKLALQRYNNFYMSYPKSELADEAAWNRIDLFFKMNQVLKAAESYYDFSQKFPNHEKSLDALKKSATLFESLAYIDKAAMSVKGLATKDKKNQDIWKSVYGDYLAVSQSPQASLKYFKSILSSPGISKTLQKSAGSSFFALVDRHNKESFSAQELNSLANSSSALRAIASQKLTQLYEQNDLLPQALRSIQTSGDQTSGASQMVLGREALRRLKGLKLRNQINVVVSDIEKKTETLDQAQGYLQGAAQKLETEDAIRALNYLGQAYDGYVKDLEALKPDSSLSGEESESFKAQIEEIIIAFEEKAAESLEQAESLAKKSQIRNGVLGSIRTQLNKVNGVKTEAVRMPKYQDILVLPSKSMVSASVYNNWKTSKKCSLASTQKMSLVESMSYWRACAKEKNWTVMTQWARKTLDKYPDSPWGFYLNSIAYGEAGQLEKAFWFVEQAKLKAGGQKNPFLFYQSHRLKKIMGLDSESFKDLELALKYYPTFYEANLQMAKLYFNDLDYKMSEKIYRRLLRKKPNSLELNLGLAESLAQQNNYKPSISYFVKSFNVGKSRSDIALRIANIYEFKLKNDKEAYRYLSYYTKSRSKRGLASVGVNSKNIQERLVEIQKRLSPKKKVVKKRGA